MRRTRALDAVLRLRGVRYSWRVCEYPDYGLDDRRHLGLLAQEVGQVLPEAVYEGEAGTLSISYGQLIPVLIEAIKAQQAEIEALSARLDRR